MSDLQQRAIDKLDAECENHPDNMAYRAIEEYLRSRLIASDADCEAILTEGKTIAGAYAEMEKAAREKRKNQTCVVIAPDEAFRIVSRYFGLDAKSQTSENIQPNKTPAPAVEVKSIFDLL